MVPITREFEWNVENLSHYLVSEVFEIFLDDNTTKWQLLLYRENQKVYAQLRKVESATNFYVVDLSLNTSNNEDAAITRQYDVKYFYETWFYAHTLENVYLKSISYRMSVPKDSFIMKIKISLIPKSPESDEKSESKCSLPNYERFLKSEKLSDFRLICCDGEKIPAHRFVLIANAPAMYKMLCDNHTKNKKVYVQYDGETMLQVLRFLYTGKIENIFKLESTLLGCAEFYELNSLKTFVAQLMIKHISIDNVLDYFELADQHDENDLLRKCSFFIHNHYSEIQEHVDWENFDPKMKALMKVSYLRKEYKNPVYVLKSLMAYEPSKLPNEYKSFP